MMPLQRPRVLVVDDDREIQTTVGALALAEGFEVATTVDGGDAVGQLRQHPAHLVLVSVRRRDDADVELVRAIRDVSPGCQVALMSADAAPHRVIEAIACGAVDYLHKPLDVFRVRALLTAVRDEHAERRAVLALEEEVARRLEFCGMVGRGPAMLGVFDLIRRLAPHTQLALVSGDAGTGKGLAARALHAVGPRRSRPFVAINCSAVVDTLLERELFGYVHDRFDDASQKAGVFEAADGGTIFLDHVGDIPLSLQAKLLHVIDTATVQRLGSSQPQAVDVHVIGATERSLRGEVDAGRFDARLYEGFVSAEVRLPALRERVEDLPYLTASFVHNFAKRFDKPLSGMTVGAERLLRDASWDGNVRQLRNVLERACMLAEGEFISETELATAMGRDRGVPAVSPLQVPAAQETHEPQDLPAPLCTIERQHIVRTLDQVGGNKATAARLLGISRRAFYRQLERHGLHTRATGARRTSHTERAPSMEHS